MTELAEPLTVMIGSLGFVFDGDVLHMRLVCAGRWRLGVDKQALLQSRARVRRAQRLRARAGLPLLTP